MIKRFLGGPSCLLLSLLLSIQSLGFVLHWTILPIFIIVLLTFPTPLNSPCPPPHTLKPSLFSTRAPSLSRFCLSSSPLHRTSWLSPFLLLPPIHPWLLSRSTSDRPRASAWPLPHKSALRYFNILAWTRLCAITMPQNQPTHPGQQPPLI